jgi:uncharacterized alkaline shock family protein YloU
MNTLNRTLVVLVDLIVLALLAIFILLTTGALAPEALVPSPAATQLRQLLPTDPPARVAAIAASAALAFLGLVLLYYELRPAEAREHRVTLRNDAGGRVTVDMDGLDEMANREARALPGVRAARSHITDTGGALRVAERVLVDPGTSVPDIAHEVQARVKAVVEHTVGRPVSEVRIDAAVARPNQERPPRHLR